MTVRLLLFAILLAGCNSQPAPRPDPPPPPAPIVACVVPGGLTGVEKRPVKPSGTYTQAAVAEFMDALYEWGARGWTRVEEIRSWSDACDRRTRPRASE